MAQRRLSVLPWWQKSLSSWTPGPPSAPARWALPRAEADGPFLWSARLLVGLSPLWMLTAVHGRVLNGFALGLGLEKASQRKKTVSYEGRGVENNENTTCKSLFLLLPSTGEVFWA